MGALIAFEQDANVLEFAKSEGIHLDSVVTRELLVSLFVPESVNKLHDGAVLIRDLRIARAGVFFPMPDTKILDAQLGSRHRAALGITEETDAVVVVVSEERGTISFCFSGNIVSNLDGQSLRHALLGLFGRSARKKGAAAKKAPTPTPAPAQREAIRSPPATSLSPRTISPQTSTGTLKTVAPPKLIVPSMPMRSPTDGPPPSTATPGPSSVRPSTFVPSTPLGDTSPRSVVTIGPQVAPKRPLDEGDSSSAIAPANPGPMTSPPDEES
jgi:hypothetical protein